MTDTEAKELIKKVENKLHGLNANNYFGYQVKQHLEEFKRTGKHANVLKHYINHKPLYLQHKVFYFSGIIVDRNKIEYKLYTKTSRHKIWKAVQRIAKKSVL
jgi:hypothetical protein